MSRPITERMAAARDKMVQMPKRTPRVFFLEAEHFAEFAATNPPTMEATFSKHGVAQVLTVLSFEGLAVRQSQSSKRGASKLYCCIGTSVSVPIR